MRLFGKPYSQITSQDIDRLLDEKVRESKTLDYKESLAGSSDAEKRGFLADVSSFANTIGGIIIFGIQEERDEVGNKLGIPAVVKGLEDFRGDEDIRRLENIIRSGLEPAFGNFWFHSVKHNDKQLLLLAIGRSTFAPHMVSFKNDSRFFLRSNTGNQQMSVLELRHAFSEYRDWIQKAEAFRNDRIVGFDGRPHPPNLQWVRPVFVHVIPLGRAGEPVSMKNVAAVSSRFSRLLEEDLCATSYNLEGFVIYDSSDHSSWYAQFFRDGTLEIYYSNFTQVTNDGTVQFNPYWCEHSVIRAIDAYNAIGKEIEVAAPFFVSLSMLRMKGVGILPPRNGHHWMVRNREKKFASDSIDLPGITIESENVSSVVALKPLFDMLWQAAGFPESIEYTKRHVES